MQAKLLRANGKIEFITPKNGQEFTYEELRDYVGGFIEHLVPPGKTGAIMFCNEEGKLLGLPRNELATQVWQEFCEPGSMRSLDDVVGDVVLCHRSQVS